MTDSMIDRIAAIIHNVVNEAYQSGVEETGINIDDRYVALIILEEMREPTEEMDAVGRAAVRDDGVTGWEAMIDAALREKPQ